MADSILPACSPSPQIRIVDITETRRIGAEVAREIAPFFFPFERIRPKRKSTAERRHIAEVRAQLYQRSEGLCELGSSPNAGAGSPSRPCTPATSFTAAAAERGILTT
jgi:hypothetical protein